MTEEAAGARRFVRSVEFEFRRYKKLGELAMAQLDDAEITMAAGEGSNTVASLVWHVSGNFRSRFTDFLTTDGEKPWRNRSGEFEPRNVSRDALMRRWEEGWSTLFEAVAGLGDADLGRVVRIRGVEHRVDEALHRSVCHAAYHVGQIVYFAKIRRGADWKEIGMRRGASVSGENGPPEHKGDG